MDKLLCHICGNMFSYTETLRRHLGSHENINFHCSNCEYISPIKDALKRHLKKHNKTACRQLVSNQTQTKKSFPKKLSRIETKAYQADPSNVNSYIHQQSLPKPKEIFLWILHELDIQPRNSRPYYLSEPVIIPHETKKLLQDPRESASLSSKIDHILNQECEISASLSDLDMMLRQLESEDAPPPSTDEETNAWTVLDSLGHIANGFNEN